jgi:molybdopterin biosynthesis enzyme
MTEYKTALDQIYKSIQKKNTGIYYESPVNIPPYRISRKDGYAVQASGGKRRKTVIGYISTNDEVITTQFLENEIFKISIGAPVPKYADCVVPLEDTKLIKSKKSNKKWVELLVEPEKNSSIR